jgi:hypothetical protein
MPSYESSMRNLAVTHVLYNAVDSPHVRFVERP